MSMENFEKNNNLNPTDFETALFWANLIENPYEDADGNNLRMAYVEQAKNVLGSIKEDSSKKFLESIIQKYSGEIDDLSQKE